MIPASVSSILVPASNKASRVLKSPISTARHKKKQSDPKEEKKKKEKKNKMK